MSGFLNKIDKHDGAFLLNFEKNCSNTIVKYFLTFFKDLEIPYFTSDKDFQEYIETTKDDLDDLYFIQLLIPNNIGFYNFISDKFNDSSFDRYTNKYKEIECIYETYVIVEFFSKKCQLFNDTLKCSGDISQLKSDIYDLDISIGSSIKDVESTIEKCNLLLNNNNQVIINNDINTQDINLLL